jgi:hypothetical protein
LPGCFRVILDAAVLDCPRKLGALASIHTLFSRSKGLFEIVIAVIV